MALDRWIRAGNTLLVLAALTDRPSFAQLPHTMYADLQLLTGLSAHARAGENPGHRAEGHAGLAAAKPGEPRQGRSAQGARQADRGAAGTAAALAGSESGASLFRGRRHRAWRSPTTARASVRCCVPRDGFALTLAHEADSRAGVLWVRPDGAGTIIVSGFASLFTNRALGLADNARLLANLIAVTVGPRGTVIFDDEHQGLTAAYDPAKFYRDRRLYATIVTLALVWLVWVLGGTQLQMPLAVGSAPRESELVRTTGLFFARVLQPAARRAACSRTSSASCAAAHRRRERRRSPRRGSGWRITRVWRPPTSAQLKAMVRGCLCGSARASGPLA